MKYQIEITKKAFKFIQKQDTLQRKRILSAISKLPEGDIKHMQGTDNAYRLRVGDYRVIYTTDNGKYIITVINVGNRGQIYK